jgi:hypothetical protein
MNDAKPKAPRSVRLVVAEDGTALPVDCMPESSHEQMLVIRQSDGESPLGLAHRTVGELARL